MAVERRFRAVAGFTLVELLIALVVLSVALAGMIPLIIQITRANAYGRATTQAAAYSQDVLESLKVVPFGDASLSAGTHVETSPPAGFTRSWTVVNSGTGTQYSANVIGIEVTTTWTDVRGGTHTARAFTVRANF